MNLEDLKLRMMYIKDGDNVQKIETRKNNIYIIKDNGWYGVGIDIGIDKSDFFEKFENVRLTTKIKYFSNKNHKLLELVTNKEELIEAFSNVCYDFVQKFELEEFNDNIYQQTSEWWNEWKKLLGNSLKNELNYDLLGELLVLNYMLSIDSNALYSSKASHDIETDAYCVEVKSTVEKYSAEIHINSQYQLENNMDKLLKLAFVRLERSSIGYSINDVVEILKEKGYDVTGFSDRINNLGTSNRQEKYKILEARLYDVDSDFPRITLKSLKNEELPKGIVKIEYIVDLEAIDKYKSIDLNI